MLMPKSANKRETIVRKALVETNSDLLSSWSRLPYMPEGAECHQQVLAHLLTDERRDWLLKALEPAYKY